MNKEFVSIDNVMLNMLDGLGGMNQISESEHDQMLNRFILVNKTQEGPNKAIFPSFYSRLISSRLTYMQTGSPQTYLGV